MVSKVSSGPTAPHWSQARELIRTWGHGEFSSSGNPVRVGTTNDIGSIRAGKVSSVVLGMGSSGGMPKGAWEASGMAGG